MQLIFDYLPVVAFFVAYQQADIYMATIILMVTMPLVPLGHWIFTRQVGRIYLISTALVLILGGITLALRNSLFLIWKPTILNWALAAACIGSLYIGERPLIQRLLQSAVELSARQWRQLTVLWGAFFAISGAANIFVAYRFGESAWVSFKLFGLLGMTLAFMVVQGIWLAVMISRNERQAKKESPGGVE
ncbi:MAG: septation protein IspZ [Gammaproteobacteria bacterium]